LRLGEEKINDEGFPLPAYFITLDKPSEEPESHDINLYPLKAQAMTPASGKILLPASVPNLAEGN